MVDDLAAGLSAYGVRSTDRLAILSENRPEWLACDLAINKLGAVSVPIHATANQSLIEYILKDSGSKFIFISAELYKKHQVSLKQYAGVFFDFKIILFDQGVETEDADITPFVSLFDKKHQVEAVKGDLASIVYTSGTTGEPKGVMLTNANFLSNAEAACEAINVTPEDKFLSFLPLSHVLERTAGSYIPILHGASIAYAEGIKQLSDNLKEVKPTILISVPRVFERMQDKIFASMRDKNPWVKKLFYWSLKQKESGFSYNVADFLINRKIRGIFGGHLRFAVSGGAPINERILRFFGNVGVKIVEGYGLTETSPIITENTLEHNRPGTVGRPIRGVEVKIAEDKEILVKGPGVMQGYWQKEADTKETFDDEGWFKTGDFGFLDRNNFLTVIGRKKNIIVLSNGKNVYPEKIEAQLNLAASIGQCVVVGHRRSCVAALIVLNEEYLAQKIKEGKGNINKIVSDEINRVNRELMPHEAVKKFHLLDKVFTIEDNELTPTLKVRRHYIEAKYSDLIEGLYA